MVEKALITADKARIVYDIYPRDTSETVVLIHGNASNRHYFDAQLAIYRRDFQVITFDSRAHGQSSNGSKDLTFEQIATDLAQLIRAEKIDQVALVGFSDGANIALVFAKLFPELLACLVLNAGNIRISGLLLSVQIIDEILYLTTKFASVISKRLQKLLPIRRLLVKNVGVDWDDLAAITAPTLVVSGDRDVVRPAHSRKIAAAIPNSQLKILHGGHSYGRKFPITFAKMATEFIKHRGTK